MTGRLPRRTSHRAGRSRPDADRPRSDRARPDRAPEDRTTASRTTADRFSGDWETADRTTADRSSAGRTTGDRTAAGRSSGGRSSGDRSSGDRSSGDRFSGDRSRSDRARSSGKRVVESGSARLRASRLIVAAMVLAALGAVYGFATISPRLTVGSAAPAIRSGDLPVTSALVACPAPGTGTLTGGGLALASSGSGTSSGQAMLTQLSPGGGTGVGSSAGTTVHVLTQPGQLIVSHVPEAAKLPKGLATVQQMAGNQVPTSLVSGGLVVQAVGALAQGLDAEQLSPDGLPTARCQSPGSDFWFVGPGASKPHIQLYLLNTDGQPADASVSLMTDAGPWIGPSDSGITVPPYSMVNQDLTKLLQTSHAVSLNVTTSSGRVVAAVRETTDATTAGIWLPPVQVPSVSQYLPGLPGTPGTPELFISVPGDLPAQVQVTAITRHGSYQPTGGTGISVLSHTATGLQLPSLAGQAATLKVTSNVPVAAVVMLPGGPNGAPGVFITGAGPITQQAVLAASPQGNLPGSGTSGTGGTGTTTGLGSSELVLSAPNGAARVSVVQAIPGESLSSQTAQIVQIPAKSTTTVLFHLNKNQSSASSIVIVVTPLPGSGPVYAARIAELDGNPDTILPLLSTPTSVLLPPVRQSLAETWK